ncbi:MAG TPA: hypothetical protein VGM88_09505 [Kofleriaceae bacterium]
MSAIVAHLRALTRSWQGWVILVLLSTQLLLPLTYYVARRDPHDERFAWRMFSPMRMAKCAPHFWVNDHSVDPYASFHEGWVEIAKRGRFRVVEEMGAALCAANPGASVRVSLECTYVDRDATTYGGYDICHVPEL